MKKLFLFLFAAMTVFCVNDADARAVKLGRSKANKISAGVSFGTEQQCYEGQYLDKATNTCKNCADAMDGCTKCSSATSCDACTEELFEGEKWGYELVNHQCKKAYCVWNEPTDVMTLSKCSRIDGTGSKSGTTAITVPTKDDISYGTTTLRFKNNATVSGGKVRVANLIATAPGDSSLSGTLNTKVTFNTPVRIDGTVTLQEDANNAAAGTSVAFSKGLEGSVPSCEVVKYVLPYSSTQTTYAYATVKSDTNTTCKCNDKGCALVAPAPSNADPGDTCTNNHFWNANGAHTVGTQYDCFDGYGANASISIPSGHSKFVRANIRFWDYASVSGALSTKKLESVYHDSSRMNDLDAIITFNGAVEADNIVLQEAISSKKGQRKGIKMVFKGGLKGDKKCTVRKQLVGSGCGYASCQNNTTTDATCTCTNSECSINNDTASSCNSSNNEFWNGDGSHTAGRKDGCLDFYGSYATITIPNGANYSNVNIRFWSRAAVNGSFTTDTLRSTYHTASALNDLNTTITFNNAVTASKVELAEAASGGKGVTMKFPKGLSGNPTCKVVKQKSGSGCGYASCQDNMTTTTTCTCTTSECKLN